MGKPKPIEPDEQPLYTHQIRDKRLPLVGPDGSYIYSRSDNARPLVGFDKKGNGLRKKAGAVTLYYLQETAREKANEARQSDEAEKIPPFTKLPHFLIRSGKYSTDFKIAYIYLLSYAGGKSDAWPSTERIAKELAISNNRVKLVIDELKQAKLILDTERRFRKNIHYKMAKPKEDERFVYMPNYLIRSPYHSTAFKALYALLISYQGSLEEQSHPSYAKIKKELAIKSDATVSKLIQELQRENLIINIDKERGIGCRYYMLDLVTHWIAHPGTPLK